MKMYLLDGTPIPEGAIALVAIASILGAIFAVGAGLQLYKKYILVPAGWPNKDIWWEFGGWAAMVVLSATLGFIQACYLSWGIVYVALRLFG